MKTILVPFDFSDCSKNALSYAAQIGKKLQIGITLLHAYSKSSLSEYPNGDRNKASEKLHLKELEERLENFCRQVNENCACEAINVEGAVKKVLLDKAEKLKPELMVIGTEDIHPTDKIIFGTIAGNVVKDANCTVLVIPQKTPVRLPERIAFAVDYHDSDVHDIRFLKRIAQQFGADIHIIHVLADDNVEFETGLFEDFKRKLHRSFPDCEFTFGFLRGEDVATELENYKKREKIDMIAVAKTKKSLLDRWIVGSISQQLFRHADVPLLVFSAKDKFEELF